ncbi:MAG: phosphoribosylglycinamide formyltransferase [Myxococcota bacterium]
MKVLNRLIKKSDDILKVVAFISGSGTNLIKIIEHQEETLKIRGRYLYKVVGILTDNPKSNAVRIGEMHNIPVEINDIEAFYRSKGLPKKDLSIREEFDKISLDKIKKYNPDIIVLAGYMSILTNVIIKRYLAINVHPADLSIRDRNGKRRYVGAHPIRDAILAKERFIRSSTHIVEEIVDNGRLLLISEPVEIILPDGFDPLDKEQLKSAEQINQNRLKEGGDWKILPLTLDYIALGLFEVDEDSTIYFKGSPIPEGLRLEKNS